MSKEKVLYNQQSRYLESDKLKGLLDEVQDDSLVLISQDGDFYTIQEIVQDEEGDIIIRVGSLY